MDSPTTILTSVSTQTSLYADKSPSKRKRRPAGTPDPDAEVIALSPKTLMESDRYTCEICNQGFQRDQNLQMHRRRHKVPWKLLKRVDLEVRKRVYVCPEPSCLHHNPCHALGDLVGIKKHYRRKHSSMKQWECDKCSKAYAVQSDYKAHLKTCGTRGHCCDCGRVFSRVESFIEHQDTCTAARNKKGSASSELEPASLPSLAVPSTYHAPIMPTHPSNFTEKAAKDSHLHEYGAASINIPLSPLHLNCQDRSNPLPARISASPASPASAPAMNAHACIAIPPTAPPPPCPAPALPVIAVMLPRHSLHSTAPSTRSQATPDVGILWETQQPCVPQPHNTELQLLPTSKAHLNQLESSQSSVTWGRDIASTNSTASGTCSSPASKTVDDKRMHKGADYEEMLPLSSAAFTAAAAPCKLQLSIGLSNTDQFTQCEKSTSLHVSRDLASQGSKTKQVNIDSKATSTPWLAWSAYSLHVNDAYHDVPSIGVAKGHSSLRASPGTEKLGRTCCINAYEGATDLGLSTGFDYSSVRFNQPGAEKVHDLQQMEDLLLSCSKTAAAESSDQNCTKPSHIMEDEDVIEILQVPRRPCKQLFDSEGACEEPKLLRCSSASDSIVALDVSNQPQTELPNSLYGSIKEADRLSEMLQFAEILNFSPGTTVSHEKMSFSLGPEIRTTSEVAEMLVQKAREKLRRASEEKLEAEKAWREARREREQAEEELAKAQRIADYNRMVAIGKGPLMEKQLEEGTATRKANGSSSTSSSPCNSIPNSQASSSSLQIMHAAGGVLSSAPSFITCPTCHHTQILYPSPNNMGTLFLGSPVELNAPASTLTRPPLIKVPSSPSHFS